MLARMLWAMAVGLLLVGLVGCMTAVDPNTGQKLVSVDPNAAAMGETVAGAGAAIAPLFGPIGGGIGGILATLLVVWRKVKPQLVTLKTQAEHYHASTAATVTAIEEFKKADPANWDKLKVLIEGQLTKQGLDPKIIENVIRAIRGLPAKA